MQGSVFLLSIETDNPAEIFAEVLPEVEGLGMRVVKGFFSAKEDGWSKFTFEIDSPYRRCEDVELFVNLIRNRFPHLQVKCEYETSELSSFLDYIDQENSFQKIPLMNMVLKTFFHVLKKTWGVIANVFMYQTGVKTGEVLARDLHYDAKEEDVIKIIESLFENWKVNDLIEDYDIQLNHTGFRISLYGMLGYNSRNADTPAYFVKGLISGLVSGMLEKKLKIDLNEDGAKIEYTVCFT